LDCFQILISLNFYYEKLFIPDSTAIFMCIKYKAQTPVLTSSELPIVIINTNQQEIRDDFRIIADMGMIYTPKQRNIDHFIINEFSKNVDAYRISAFLYKDKDSKDESYHPAGKYSVIFNAADLSSVVYYYQMTTSSGFQQSHKMILLK
jgi:hypothetical protein